MAHFSIGALVVMAGLTVGYGCSAAQYELCRADARARFHKDADRCETEDCIDALSKREEADLKECR